jgi:antagonist of KipI
MDQYSHRLANVLAGNTPLCATLEVTLLGPEIRFDGDTTFAVTGAVFALTLDDRPLASSACHRAAAGSVLRFGARARGARAYIAIDGGIDVPEVLGSRSTHVTSRMGGHEGRPLKAGDVLPLGESVGASSSTRADSDERALPLPRGGTRLRMIPGPQDAWFRSDAMAALAEGRYEVTPQSDRMGYRLKGAPLEHVPGAYMVSDVVPMGALQVPSSGQPILLLSDRQTTGGYPIVATVITADLPLAGQLAPGDWIEFRTCTAEEARAALIEQEERAVARGCSRAFLAVARRLQPSDVEDISSTN